MTYRVKTGIHYPAPGHVPPIGERCDPKHEMAPEIGSLVDLSHLSEVALTFFLSNGCVEPVQSAPAPVTASTTEPKGGK